MRTVKVTQDVPANALALSPDDTQVVIAGRHGGYWNYLFIYMQYYIKLTYPIC